MLYIRYHVVSHFCSPMQMSRRDRKSANHAFGSNSDVSDDRFAAMPQALTDSQKTQAEQQAKVNEDNAQFRTQLMELM